MQCRAKFLLTYLRNISNIQTAMNNLRYIQKLSGNNESKTTEIYTHVTKKGYDKVVSPLEYLDLSSIEGNKRNA